MTAVVEVRGLRKSYGSVEAVRDVSFTVDEGEVVAVLGPNGAGKTTTMEILEGYRTRDAGEVRVLGRDPSRTDSAFRSRIGIVLQECGIDPYLSVSEVLEMHASYYPHPRDIDEVIELVGLVEKRTARVKTLSGGQQRRLDLALGLVGDPELLFLDEPTTGFDPGARRQSWDIVRGLTSLGKTILLTTHYMDEAQVLANRVIVIARGVIVAEGPPDALGGRARGQVVVSFELPARVARRDLPVPPAAASRRTVEYRTDSPTMLLHTLTAWAVKRKIELRRLTVLPPTLEDVYLDLVGEPAEEGA